MDKTTIALRKTTDDLRKLIAKCGNYGRNDSDNRSIICTPCSGHYGDLAHWSIAVEGSPPRGVVIAATNWAVFISCNGRSRRMSTNQLEIVNAFVTAHLDDYCINSIRIG